MTPATKAVACELPLPSSRPSTTASGRASAIVESGASPPRIERPGATRSGSRLPSPTADQAGTGAATRVSEVTARVSAAPTAMTQGLIAGVSRRPSAVPWLPAATATVTPWRQAASTAYTSGDVDAGLLPSVPKDRDRTRMLRPSVSRLLTVQSMPARTCETSATPRSSATFTSMRRAAGATPAMMPAMAVPCPKPSRAAVEEKERSGPACTAVPPSAAGSTPLSTTATSMPLPSKPDWAISAPPSARTAAVGVCPTMLSVPASDSSWTSASGVTSSVRLSASRSSTRSTGTSALTASIRPISSSTVPPCSPTAAATASRSRPRTMTSAVLVPCSPSDVMASAPVRIPVRIPFSRRCWNMVVAFFGGARLLSVTTA